jgi:hypothetical protein
MNELSGRGTERGAEDVFNAAWADAHSAAAGAQDRRVVSGFSARRLTVMTSIAAAVLFLGGVVAAVNIDGGGNAPPDDHFAAGTTSTTNAAATATTLSQATKVYLASTRLIVFDACPELASYAKTKALDVVGPYGLPGYGGGRDMLASGAATPASGTPERNTAAADSSAAPKAAAAQASPDFSQTNVQEAGIDEPDSVKTDGKTIWSIANGKVFATSTGSDPALLASIAVDGAREMLLVGKQLIVVSGGGGMYYATDGGGARGDMAVSSMPVNGGAGNTTFTVVDVSDPRAMKATGHLDVEGSYLSARLVDGVARIVVRTDPNLPFVYPSQSTPDAEAEAKAHNQDVVRRAGVDSWLPHFTTTNASGQTSPSKPLVTCNSSYHPPTFSGLGMLSVLTFNPSDPSATKGTSVMAGGDIVYASATRLYVATNSWGAVKDGTVTPSSSTLIHAFDISDKTNAAYRESGMVRGTVLNQFSMSELDGALRVATTDASGGSESFVTVLGDSGNALVQVGQVGGLGKGERIYAVRFIGPVGYVVTFRQFDPLYVVDLHDVSKPRVVGSLEVSGYSAYLHPIGDGRLLAVGAEIVNNEPEGVQATIYDVRNPASPKVVTRHQMGSGFSSVNFDHHAFLYWEPTKLAVLPVNTYNSTCAKPSDGSAESCSNDSFQGAVGLHVGDSSLDEVGRAEPPDSQQYGGGIERSVVVGSRLYLMSSRGVLVTSLNNLGQQAWVAYPQDQPQPQTGGPESKPAG